MFEKFQSDESKQIELNYLKLRAHILANEIKQAIFTISESAQYTKIET